MMNSAGSKIYVGKRLARAAYNTAYGGTGAFTGPTISGCALSAASLTIEFDTAMLKGDKVLLQEYSKPNFTPYYHGHGNPMWHSGSQLYVQTDASSFCVEPLPLPLPTQPFDHEHGGPRCENHDFCITDDETFNENDESCI